MNFFLATIDSVCYGYHISEFDDAYEKGRADARANKSKRRPCDEHAWGMFKSEEAKTRQHKLNRSYEEGYDVGRRER